MKILNYSDPDTAERIADAIHEHLAEVTDSDAATITEDICNHFWSLLQTEFSFDCDSILVISVDDPELLDSYLMETEPGKAVLVITDSLLLRDREMQSFVCADAMIIAAAFGAEDIQAISQLS